MSRKALDYAEQELGVHAVHEQALKDRDSLKALLDVLAAAQDTKRRITENLTVREAELGIEERGKHPDMAQGTMDKHLKHSIQKDAKHASLRKDLADAISEAEGLENEITILKRDIDIGVARMNELGGYFGYLSMMKTEKVVDKLAEAMKVFADAVAVADVWPPVVSTQP